MSPMNEIDAMKTIDELLLQIKDDSARDRILSWAWQKFSSKPKPSLNPNDVNMISEHSNRSKKAGKVKAKSKAKAKSGPSIVRDLSLKPKDKKSFRDFVAEIRPNDNQEKCTTSVYYLHKYLGLKSVNLDHIYTCYDDAKWRKPNFYNVVSITGSRKGWLNTGNMDAITLTTRGENLIDYDLPEKNKKKAKK